ncbi:MAG: hypothetical protein ACT4RN_16685 [Pseudonocardia sp.]
MRLNWTYRTVVVATTLAVAISPLLINNEPRERHLATKALIATQGGSQTVLADGSVETTVPLVLQDKSLSEVRGRVPATATTATFSPAGCRITFVDTPHFSDSVPGAVKVNSKVQCNRPVPELSLSVTLLDETAGRVARKTLNEVRDKAS